MNAELFDRQQAQGLRISQALITTSEILSPPPEENAGEWADRVRILPPESPEPGRWRTSRVPFWRDIYEAFISPGVQLVVIVCGAQMSKTEGLFNVMAQRLDTGPYVPILYIGPTEKWVKAIAKDRWQKLLRSVPRLWSKTAKGQSLKTVEQFVGGIRCGWGWAGSAAEVAGHPAGRVLVDERSRMGSDVAGEGDPVSLARARTKNYVNRKIGVCSTPTLEGADPTWSLLDEGDLHFWSWRCVHCGAWFVPHLALLHWPEKATAAQAAANAFVGCPECGGVHNDAHKASLNGKGAYQRFRHLRDAESSEGALFQRYVLNLDREEHQNPTVSFWISGLASPWASFGDIAAVLVAAYLSGDPERIQAEVNTWGGELFRLQGDAPEWTEVFQNRREYARGQIMLGGQFLTLGADVQKRGIYYCARLWGAGEESWGIDEGFLAGETAYDEVWLAFGQLIQGKYGDMPLRRVFIDSGYRPGADENRRPDHAVYTFCRRFPGLAYPTKGHDTLDRPLKPSTIDYSIGGALIKGGVKIYHVDTDYFKRWLHARVRWPKDQPGGWHLHRDITEDYCKQIVAEELVLKPSGQTVWIKRRRENHYLDCEILSHAAAVSLGLDRLRTPTPQAETAKALAAVPSRSRFHRRKLF